MKNNSGNLNTFEEIANSLTDSTNPFMQNTGNSESFGGQTGQSLLEVGNGTGKSLSGFEESLSLKDAYNYFIEFDKDDSAKRMDEYWSR